MSRSMDRNTRSSGTPAASRARTVYRIMTSGPTVNATEFSGSDPDPVPRPHRAQRVRDRPDVANGVQHGTGRRRVAADRDRDLADARYSQHVELAGLEAERLRRLEFQCHRVVRLPPVRDHLP